MLTGPSRTALPFSFICSSLVSVGITILLTACGGDSARNASPEPLPAEPSADTTETAPEMLTVATEPSFPPFQSLDDDGELVGFDIDLMEAIGKVAGFEVEFEELPFDGILPALQAGMVDAAISGITITAERDQTVDFSRPYLQAGLVIAVQTSNTTIQSIKDLQNQKIAVQIGTTGADKAVEILGAELSAFDSALLALEELSRGKVDAVISDGPVTYHAIKTGEVEDIKVVGSLLSEEFYGIALPQDSENLSLINTALTTLMEDGTYAEIYQQWFDTPPPSLPDTAQQ